MAVVKTHYIFLSLVARQPLGFFFVQIFKTLKKKV